MKTKKKLKQTYIPGTAPTAPVPTPKLQRLICNRECDIPGVGAWKSGQAVENPDHLKLLDGHPYFTKAED